MIRTNTQRKYISKRGIFMSVVSDYLFKQLSFFNLINKKQCKQVVLFSTIFHNR